MFVSSKSDNNQQHLIHSKNDNIEIMIDDKTDEVIKELFEPLKKRYQNNLQLMKGSDFLLDYLHYCIINVIK